MPNLLQDLNATLIEDGFRKASYDDLFDILEYAKETELEGLSYAWCEIKQRDEFRHIRRAEFICERRDIVPVEWLPEARAMLQLLDPPKPRNYKASTYVILRDYFKGADQCYGVYVGVTAKQPEARLKEHLTKGHSRAARGLPDHGICLLKTLMYPYVKVPSRYKLEYETALHLALSLAVPKVWGDTLIDYEDWLPELHPRLAQELWGQYTF